MEENCLAYIEKWLKTLEPMMVKPAVTATKTSPKRNIEAVVFDIYGTLLVSASGDIDESEFSTEILRNALDESGLRVNADLDMGRTEILGALMADYIAAITFFHEAARWSGVRHPEVNIVKVWERIVNSGVARKTLISDSGVIDFKKLAFVFEIQSNKVYPMPGMVETIRFLSERKLPLGIVSNAQFYTPVIMNYFLDGEKGLTENVRYFEPDLTFFSYKNLKSKPDAALFSMLGDRIEKKFAIRRENVLYVGNDMIKDIYPAAREGFMTTLFAGDQRSFRQAPETGSDNPRPDYIVTELDQIKDLI